MTVLQNTTWRTHGARSVCIVEIGGDYRGICVELQSHPVSSHGFQQSGPYSILASRNILMMERICHTSSFGAQVNPAVSIAMALTRHISFLRGIMFVISQCGGGIAGAALLYGFSFPFLCSISGNPLQRNSFIQDLSPKTRTPPEDQLPGSDDRADESDTRGRERGQRFPRWVS
ncbi:unnamed protein product [Nezara viridula]|uniref:Uncharacterized protein n=1 Tax=Nezara viridula TaxID=85310 RepID=A0A9P0MRC6_NEZVI|nr:unnamed protein product [Nezara viridula]